MACTLKKCCFFVNLRLGTVIITLICAVVEFTSLIIGFSAIWNSLYLEHISEYIYVLRLMLSVFLIFTCVKLSLCACLYVGLLERRPDHLEIWYKGYTVCEIVFTVILIFKAIKEAEGENVLFWLIVVGNILRILTTFYFILVVRSYHHQMCRQPNYYQDFSCNQLGKTYSEKPKDANGEIVIFSAPTKDKKCGLYPNLSSMGTVYATPESSQLKLPAMPSFLLNNERPRVDLEAAEKQRSKPTKKNLSVTFDNPIKLE